MELSFVGFIFIVFVYFIFKKPIKRLVGSVEKVVVTIDSEVTKLQNDSLKSLLEEQELTDDEMEQIKKLLDKKF